LGILKIKMQDLINITKNLDSVAIIDDSESITYKRLLELTNTVETFLINQGIKIGDRVAIYDYNTINFVAILLGVLKSGAVAVPIDENLPSSMIEFIIEDSKPSFILNNIIDIKKETNINESRTVTDKDPAIILYTSGSTGRPKGVIIPHLHKWSIYERAKNSPQRKIIVAAPSYHMNGLSNIEFSLASHSTLVLMKTFDPKIFISKILQYKINTITSVPTMLQMMLTERKILEKNSFDFVKHISMASAPVNRNLFTDLKLFFPNAIITNNYGLTEVGPGLFGNHPELPTPEMSVGYPRQGIEYRTVDDVLEIKSPFMMLKYNNIESKNITSDGFFVTNDMFEIDQNGFYFFKGRKDDMFTCGGHNIYPKEIEKIIEEFPGVELAIVIGVEDLYKGFKPYAFVQGTKNLNLEELKRYLGNKLPKYSCPRNIWAIETLPLTPSKKIDINYLKKQVLLRLQSKN